MMGAVFQVSFYFVFGTSKKRVIKLSTHTHTHNPFIDEMKNCLRARGIFQVPCGADFSIEFSCREVNLMMVPELDS